MAGPLLETKLHAPRVRRAGLVARPRLDDLLDRGCEAGLTLVSAPAGFGKTTLLAEWSAAPTVSGRAAAWLSLDERDNDPVVFCRYLVAALRTAVPGVGAVALALLESSQPPVDAVLTTLLNDLAAVAEDVVLVIDDYHVIDAGGVLDGVAFLVAHLPPRTHLVIASRADPALPLARLRSTGDLVEVRAVDLRFTVDEATGYLNEAMGLGLTAQDVVALEGRTEGWIAALQLAALSMHGRTDVAAFISGFAGDDRYIVDYLTEEVLQRQPQHLRDFLLQTSLLTRLSGPLCDAVTGGSGSASVLAALERANMFLVSLDDRRQWYRYHQLFADVLHARLLDEQGDTVPELHRRASVWYAAHGAPVEAVAHALAAKDFPGAADLAELAMPGLRSSRQEAVLRDWLRVIPDEVTRSRPVLSVGFAGALLAAGELEGVDARLHDAEAWLDSTNRRTGAHGSATPMVVVDQLEFRRLPAAVAIYRAGQALAGGDEVGTIRQARRALDVADGGDHLSRAAASALVGLVLWAGGDLEAAHLAYAECSAGLMRAGYVADTLGCAVVLADISLVRGRLGEARRTYEQGLQHATRPDGPVLRGTADLYVGLSEIHREHNDLAAATRALLRSQELGEHTGLPRNPFRWRVAMARIRQAEGDLEAALVLLNDAERLYVADFAPDVRPVPAMVARVRIARGEWGEALAWVRKSGLAMDDELSYRREFEHLTLARLILARYEADRAGSLLEVTELLARLLAAATEGGRTGSVIEILVLQSIAHQAGGDGPSALDALGRALGLAEPEGYVRAFFDEGRIVSALLRAAAHHGVATYARRLLDVDDSSARQRPNRHGLVEPLSERELEVLRLFGTDLGGPDIARRLHVSLSTLRTHSNHIYTKLGVNNRRAAVRRARELDV